MKINLKPVIAKAMRIAYTRILTQVPVDTGALRRSVKLEEGKIQVEIDSNSTSRFFLYTISYNDYGDYTNYGTRNYYPGAFKYGTQPDPGSFRGYSKGKGGIKPQYWSAISLTDFDEIENIVGLALQDAIGIEYEKQLVKAIEDDN